MGVRMQENFLDDRLQEIVEELEIDLMEDFREISRVNNVRPRAMVTKEFRGDRPIYIVALSDLHLGHMLFNKAKLQSTLNFIMRHDDVYVILLGDLAETATKTSIGAGLFEENMHVNDQIKELAKIFKPLADAGKILAMITGNHESRIFNMTGIDSSKLLAEKLGVEYHGHQAYVSINLNGIRYNIVAWHGAGGGSSKIGKIKATEKLKESAFCDVYISGHTHDRSYHDDFIDVLKDDGTVHRHHRHYVASGSFLEYAGGYAEQAGLAPSGTGGVLIKLNPSVKDVLVTF